MNKKGASILVFGLISFFVMTVLTVMVWQTVEKIDFDKYAGIDAQELSQGQYTAAKQQFFVQDILSEFVENDISLEGYHAYLQNNQLLPLWQDGLQLEDETYQFYSIYEQYLPEYLSDSFTKYYVAKAEQFNDKITEDGYYKESENFFLHTDRQRYAIFIDDSAIKAFASLAQPISDGSNKYVYYPHATVESDMLDSLLEEFLLPITIRNEFSECLLDSSYSQDEINVCSERTLEEVDEYVLSIRSSSIDENLLRLQVKLLDESAFFYVFRKQTSQ